MRLIHRLGYYLGGFSIGLILLAFFLSGKRASCSYFPQARVIKNIGIKKHTYSTQAKQVMDAQALDTTQIRNLIANSEVNFDKSDTRKEPCGIFNLENVASDSNYTFIIENCEKEARILEIQTEAVE